MESVNYCRLPTIHNLSLIVLSFGGPVVNKTKFVIFVFLEKGRPLKNYAKN